MAYIGNKADSGFTSLIKQDLTGASGDSLTLTHAVANANDIALYINNVRQEPVSAYSTSGTAVSLTGSVVSTDDIYVIYLARAVQTTVPPDGSVSTAKIADDAVNLTSKVTGVLPVANGGTGVSSGFSYSEGTFTPTWNGYTPYGTSGKYVKIGTQITVYVTLVTGASSNSSLIQLNNLPFQISGNQGGGFVYHNSVPLYGYNIYTLFTANSTICQLKTVSGGAEVGVKYMGSDPSMRGYSTMHWTIVYQTT